MLSAKIKKLMQSRWRKWLDRRIPKTDKIILEHDSIFIFMNKNGVLFAVILLLMLVTAINYQNNLIYALLFWLFSLSLVIMLTTYRNLAGLQVESFGSQSCFVGDEVEIPFKLSSTGKSHFAIKMMWPKLIPGFVDEVLEGKEETIKLLYKTQKRGQLTPERILLKSQYPLGIFRSWSWLSLNTQVIVFPKPIETPLQLAADGSGNQDEEILHDAHVNFKAGDDYAGVRQYRAGDPLKDISWKQSAKGKGYLTKEYEKQEFNETWLVAELLPQADLETRIQMMASWIIQAHEKSLFFGLNFFGEIIEPDNSEEHFIQCLTLLALYGQGGQQ